MAAVPWWFDEDAATAFLVSRTGKSSAEVVANGDLAQLRAVRWDFMRARGFLLPLEDAEEDGHLNPNGSWRNEGPTGANLSPDPS